MTQSISGSPIPRLEGIECLHEWVAQGNLHEGPGWWQDLFWEERHEKLLNSKGFPDSVPLIHAAWAVRKVYSLLGIYDLYLSRFIDAVIDLADNEGTQESVNKAREKIKHPEAKALASIFDLEPRLAAKCSVDLLAKTLTNTDPSTTRENVYERRTKLLANAILHCRKD